MKNLFLFFLLALGITSCQSKKTTAKVPQSLTGKWQLVEQKIGIGASDTPWSKVENGTILNFKADQNFTDRNHPQCQTGKYEMEAKKFTLSYDCSNYNEALSHSYEIKDGFLYTQPLTLICSDGCDYKYQKIAN
ncbi:MAG: lipocalin family protein [Saprospiraceae bacterium]